MSPCAGDESCLAHTREVAGEGHKCSLGHPTRLRQVIIDRTDNHTEYLSVGVHRILGSSLSAEWILLTEQIIKARRKAAR